MIHDPLCPDILNGHLPPEKCPLCELIAEVGERERANMQADIDQASYALGRKWGYAAALLDAVDAVEDRIQDLSTCNKDDDCHMFARGAALALSDIESLGGER